MNYIVTITPITNGFLVTMAPVGAAVPPTTNFYPDIASVSAALIVAFPAAAPPQS